MTLRLSMSFTLGSRIEHREDFLDQLAFNAQTKVLKMSDAVSAALLVLLPAGTAAK